MVPGHGSRLQQHGSWAWQQTPTTWFLDMTADSNNMVPGHDSSDPAVQQILPPVSGVGLLCIKTSKDTFGTREEKDEYVA